MIAARIRRRGRDRRLLDNGQGRRAMIWIMAIMMFLTVLSGALGLGMAGAGRALDRQLAGRLTVQVVEADAATRDRVVARLLAVLRQSNAVDRAVEVDRVRLAELLKPWLGEAGLDADLPMPAMIDVDLVDAPRAAAVEALARSVAPGVRVDRHATWLAPVRGFLSTLGWIAAALIVLMASATAAVVLLAARAGLDAHRGTIDILHMLGSTDLQIARLFQRRIAADTLAGGILGTVVALMVVGFMGYRIAALQSGVLAGVVLRPVDWTLITALPLAFTLLAAVAARIVISKTLARVL